MGTDSDPILRISPKFFFRSGIWNFAFGSYCSRSGRSGVTDPVKIVAVICSSIFHGDFILPAVAILEATRYARTSVPGELRISLRLAAAGPRVVLNKHLHVSVDR
jgi:hypothetical protein